MNKFVKALGDCENCLKLEPTNIKAMLRKAQALIGYDKRRNVCMKLEVLIVQI